MIRLRGVGGTYRVNEKRKGPLGGCPQGVQEGGGGVIPISDFLGKKEYFWADDDVVLVFGNVFYFVLFL